MRMSKSITVGAKEQGEGEQEIVVLELSLAQMPDALEIMNRATSAKGAPQGIYALAAALLGPDNPAAWRLLHGATSLGEDIDNLGGVALCDVAEAWVEVNTAFFDRIARGVTQVGALISGESPPETPREQAA